MKLSDFDFDLPQRLIALRPARPRSSARLLVAEGDSLSDRHVSDLPAILRPGDLLVLNDTRVIPARLTGIRRRATPQGPVEARIEVTLLEAEGPLWRALAKPLRKLKSGEIILFGGLSAEVGEISDGNLLLRFDRDGAELDAAIEATGAMPLPPYIAALRAPDAADRDDYQTVWATRRGAVAAPTASLHFDAALLAQLAVRGVETAIVTLHVGAGTFLPVKTDDVSQHRMHAEWGEVTPAAAAQITAALREGRRVIPIGTTALRLIESAAVAVGEVTPFAGTTDIFIRPGYAFKATSALLTNFHLPRSTLLMLVSALLGRQRIRSAYAHAIAEDYRFFSYGDASLLIP